VAVAALGLAAGGATYAATNGGSSDEAADLAEALNAREGTSLTADDITAAMKDVLEERLDEAVAAGRITQAQADEMLAHAGERGFHLGGPGGPHHGPGGPVLPKAAAALGLEPDALRDRLEAGTSLADVAKAQGVAPAKVIAAVRDAILASPRGDDLTKAQATARAKEIVNAEGRGPGHRGGPWGGPPPGP